MVFYWGKTVFYWDKTVFYWGKVGQKSRNWMTLVFYRDSNWRIFVVHKTKFNAHNLILIEGNKKFNVVEIVEEKFEILWF